MAGKPQPIGPWVAAVEMLKGVPPEKVTILDVGAHFGNVTAQLLNIWPKATVYCIDPEPQSLARLHERYDQNPQVHIIPKALGDKVGKATFHVCGQNTEMSSLLPRGRVGRRYYRHEVRKKIKVPVTTLDELIRKEGIGMIHLMKVDVQGGETAVFAGGASTLTQQHVRLIYSEVLFVDYYKGAAMFHQLCAQLAEFGYSLFDIYNLERSWINRQLKYGDAMWVSEAVRQRKLNRYPPDWLPSSLERRMRPDI